MFSNLSTGMIVIFELTDAAYNIISMGKDKMEIHNGLINHNGIWQRHLSLIRISYELSNSSYFIKRRFGNLRGY